MKRLGLLLVAAAAPLGALCAASAQYGGGYYPYGPGPYYGDRYRDRYYDDDRNYLRRGYGYGGAIVGHDRYGREKLYLPIGPSGRGRRSYTGQGGLCKPYRGY